MRLALPNAAFTRCLLAAGAFFFYLPPPKSPHDRRCAPRLRRQTDRGTGPSFAAESGFAIRVLVMVSQHAVRCPPSVFFCPLGPPSLSLSAPLTALSVRARSQPARTHRGRAAVFRTRIPACARPLESPFGEPGVRTAALPPSLSRPGRPPTSLPLGRPGA